MATVNEIAIKISADTSDAVTKFEQIDKLVKKIERQQATLARAGKEGGELFAQLEEEKNRLRALGDQLEHTTVKAEQFGQVMEDAAESMNPAKRTTGAVDKLKEYDALIRKVQSDLAYLDRNGLKPVNGELEKQLRTLENARAGFISYNEQVQSVGKSKGADTSRDTVQAMKTLKQYDDQIRKVQADLAFFDRNGLEPVNNELRTQLRTLEQARANFIRYSGAVRSVGTETQTAATGMRRMGRSSGQMQVAMSQLGFGVEDFMTQLGPMGLSGALRAAGNNMSMVAHSLGGAGIGAAIGISMAILPSLINMFKGTGDEAEKAEKKIKSWRDTLSMANAAAREQISHERALANIGEEDKTSGADSTMDTARKNAEDSKKELAAMQHSLDMRRLELENSLNAGYVTDKSRDDFSDTLQKGDKDIEDTFDATLRGIEARRDTAQAKLDALKQRATEESAKGGTDPMRDSDGSRQELLDSQITAQKNRVGELAAEEKKVTELKEKNMQYNGNILEQQRRIAEKKREIANYEEQEAKAQAKKAELANQDRARNWRKVFLMQKEKKIQEEMLELKKKDPTVAGKYASYGGVNVGALTQQAIQGQFKNDNDVKRKDLQKELQGVREDLRKVDKFTIVGG